MRRRAMRCGAIACFAVSLGLVTGERAKRCVEAAQKYLVVPGALALAGAAAGFRAAAGLQQRRPA